MKGRKGKRQAVFALYSVKYFFLYFVGVLLSTHGSPHIYGDEGPVLLSTRRLSTRRATFHTSSCNGVQWNGNLRWDF